MTDEVSYPIRSIITAPKGKLLLSCDLSQAEAWAVAYLANEPHMKKVLGLGLIHELAARIIFDKPIPDDITDKVAMKDNVSKDERYLGKKMNHSCNYRVGPFMIVIMINHESDKPPYVTVTLKQTKLYYQRWINFFNLSIWWKEIEDKLRIDRTLVTPYRRERTFLTQWGDSLFKEATAFIPQSTVADHMYGYIQPEVGIKGGLLSIKRDILSKYNDIKLVNSAHDSALFEVPENIIDEIEGEVKSRLQRPMIINGESFTIPVDSDIYERWSEVRKN